MPCPSQEVTLPTRMVTVQNFFLQTRRQAPVSLETIYSVVVLHKWRQMYTLLCKLFRSFSIKSSPLFIWGTDAWSSSLDIYLHCFHFGAFTKKAAASTCGAALPGMHLRETFWALLFSSAKQEGLNGPLGPHFIQRLCHQGPS